MVHHDHAITLTQSSKSRLLSSFSILCVATISYARTEKQCIFKLCSTRLSVAYLSPSYPDTFSCLEFPDKPVEYNRFPSLNCSGWKLPFTDASYSINFSYHFAIEFALGGFFRPFFSNFPEKFNRLLWTKFQHTQRHVLLSGWLCCSWRSWY
jgi:hypothetical protein